MHLPYITVIGGSYVGVKTAQTLATAFHETHRILLIEKNSHFQHLFAFPRFAVAAGLEARKSFIPFTPGTFAACPPHSGKVVQAKVTNISKSAVTLEKPVTIDGESFKEIPYEYLVIATGTKLVPPGSLPGSEKLDGVEYLNTHAEKVKESQKICVIGGGAVGVQMATDIKQLYPNKSVTLVHSRKQVMNRFNSQLHDLIVDRATELGIDMQLGSRVKVPKDGYPTDGSTFNVELEDGTKIESNFAIVCTGQVPNSELIQSLSSASIDKSGFILTKKTLQIEDESLPHVFVVGDIAHLGAPKAARPGMAQAEMVGTNIQHLLKGEQLEEYRFDPAGIHLTLGIEKNVIFRNPADTEGAPMIKMQDNGRLDMGIDDVWQRRGGGDDFHL